MIGKGLQKGFGNELKYLKILPNIIINRNLYMSSIANTAIPNGNIFIWYQFILCYILNKLLKTERITSLCPKLDD